MDVSDFSSIPRRLSDEWTGGVRHNEIFDLPFDEVREFKETLEDYNERFVGVPEKTQ